MITPAPTTTPLRSGDTNTVVNSSQWLQWFQQQQDYYDKVGKWIDPTNPNFGKILPQNAQKGLIIFADGVNSDPTASGTAGYFWWDGNKWNLLG